MKKILTVLLLGIFLINLASAFGETADFDETDGEYGSYQIESGWGILPEFLGGGDLAWVKLTENTDQCLINCYAKGEGYFNEPKNFLDGLEFKNRLGEDETSLEGVKIYVGQLGTVTKQKPIYKEICEEIPSNETNQYSTSCKNEFMGYENYTEEEMVVREYEGEEIVGDFIWEIRAKKSPGVSVDWIFTIWGERLEEWAWWEFDWDRKREINLTANVGNFSYIGVINFSADMNSDFSDLRFIDSATENIELNYTIEDFTASTSVRVRVDSQGAGSFYMYYGNAGASSNSNANDTYMGSSNSYFLDEDSGDAIDFGSGKNGTVTGATQGVGGQINDSYSFDGSGDSVTADSSITGDTTATLMTWFKTPGATQQKTILINSNTGSDHGWGFGDYQGDTRIILPGVAWGSSGTDASDDAWHSAMITRNGNQYDLYIDGGSSPISSLTNAGGTFGSDNIFGGNSLGSTLYEGEMDEIYIFPDVKTADDFLRFHTQTEPTYTVGAEQFLGADIILISPQDALQTTQTFQTFRCNASLNTDIANLTFQLNGIDTFTNSTVGTFIDLTYSENITVEGIYNWSCRAETVGGQPTQSENRTLTIHTTTPDITIHDPQPIIDYHLLGTNLTLNWTVTETGENLTTHIKNCTYEYNGVLTVLNNTLCTQINNTEFQYVLGVNNLTFNITDIFDLVNSTLVEWDINLTEINQTFNNETLEGATETFAATIRLGIGKSISAVALIYNETITAGTTSTVGENVKIELENFIIPQVGTETNLTFYWSVIFSGGEVINLSSQNQTVKNIALDNCTSFSNEILNVTMVDEEMQFVLSNTSLEVAINLLSVDRTKTVVSLSDQFDDENPLSICLSENITGGIMYSLDAIFKYTSDGYAIEYYNLVNSSLDNETTTRSITLYNLNASDSTDFQLTFTGEDFLPVENALVFIERQYIAENTFKTVELPKTDSNGQTILHLVRNDIVYNIRVVKEGEVLANFANIIAFCEDFTIGACSLPLNAISNISLVFNYDDEIGLIFQENTQYNETTGVASFSFSSTDGTTKVVRMVIERRDVFGNRSICENTVVSSSGTLSCQVDPDIADTSLVSIISVDGENKIFSEVIIDSTAYGQNGFAMFFIFAVGITLMFSGSKTWTLVGVALNYIVGISLGLIIGKAAGLGATGIFILVITMVGIWQLNKERRQ